MSIHFARGITTEWKWMISRTARIGNLLVLAVVAVFVPWLTGLAFLDATVAVPFSVLSVLIVSDLVSGALTTAEGSAPSLFVAKTTAAILFGWATGLVMLLACVVSVSFWNWHGRILLPPATILLAAGAISLGACCLAGAVIAWLPQSARARFKLIVVALLLLMGASYNALPFAWQDSLAAQTTPEGIARITLIATPCLLLLAGLVLRAAVRRQRAG